MINFDEMIDRGDEFIISYKMKQYWISQTKEYIILTLIENEESQYFNTLEDFLENARMFDGNLLNAVKNQIS
ncbi:hypothetical protein NHG25_03190 [Aerococcaceae bacterium NML191292]|nr:hypothetical protein [Aerococcaceae bacterium NML191292]MCW6662222.1 hypothetical protein [Aerococcaceae bacterium NML201209]MCW6679768.1 hypothetical protein [Aerococcaceae bacterium NML130460]